MGEGFAPRILIGVDGGGEEAVEEEIGEVLILVECLLNFAEEAAAVDASAAPHEGDAAHVEVPAILFCGGAEEHVALGVGDDFGAVEGTAYLFNEGNAVGGGGDGGGAFKDFGGGDTFVFERGEAAGEDRFADEGDGLAGVEGADDGPLTGAFLACGVEDFVDEGLAVFIFFGEDVAGDFDQEAVELALVPFGKDGGELVGGKAEAAMEQVVCLADELHVAVLDAVVDHFDVMACAVFADPVAAGGSVFDLGGDGLEDVFNGRPCGGIAAGHDGGAEARAFFAPGDAGADEEDAFRGKSFGAAVGIGEERVAAIDYDVAGLEIGQDVVDGLVDGVAGFDHEHDAAGALEERCELLGGVGADDVGALGFVGEEVVDFGGGAVEYGHFEAVVVHIEDKVLSHDGKTDEADITRSVWHKLSQGTLILSPGKGSGQ